MTSRESLDAPPFRIDPSNETPSTTPQLRARDLVIYGLAILGGLVIVAFMMSAVVVFVWILASALTT